MRRESDIYLRSRTGTGRRATDRLLTGDAARLPDDMPDAGRAELQNLLLFIGDELRESALAVAGIDAALVKAEQMLRGSSLSSERLAGWIEDRELEGRLDTLDQALSGLRHSVGSLHEHLRAAEPADPS